MLQWYENVPGVLNVCAAEVAPGPREKLAGGGALSGTTVCVAPSPLCQVTCVPTGTVVETGVVSAANVHCTTAVLFPDPEPGLFDGPFVLDPPQPTSRRSRM